MQITGKLLRDAIVSGANNIVNHKTEVDELNVFPVPDGDTGTNMSMTIKNAVTELLLLPDESRADTVADTAAAAMLRGARGNSGVILSLLFRGLARGLKGHKAFGAAEYAAALTLGGETAYKSVMKPTEGTILTVASEAAAAAHRALAESDDFNKMFAAVLEAANVALANTPELLPVLKKAGVVDAGGKGYCFILEGMERVFAGNEGFKPIQADGHKEAVVTNAAGTFEADIKFTYCTEYIVVKKDDAKDALLLRAFLETIGDSVVVVDDDEIIKIHVHTENPGKALEEGLLFGSLINLKIENMKEQHKGQAAKVTLQKKTSFKPVPPENDYGFVAVANGAGIESIFKDLGVDSIVRGGQTNNPSTEDILEAILATPARHVFVLPNNKNIIMAAELAVKLADRGVTVLQSRTIPQGISAMLAFDANVDVSENGIAMTAALDKVGTGSVTYAVRDTEFEDKGIKKGDIIAMENGKLAVVERDVTKALVKITKKLLKRDSAYIMVLYGEDIPQSTADAALEVLKQKIGGDIEIVMVNGGQPVYYYVVSVE
ncbi:MAG: DAK2 domain-containing protein [Oscillospiraceae bacterium]|nr:DAK2 domain-containing protein [Oscillospiraceae bacterium]